MYNLEKKSTLTFAAMIMLLVFLIKSPVYTSHFFFVIYNKLLISIFKE